MRSDLPVVLVVLVMALAVAAAASCTVDPPDYEEFDIACSPGAAASDCPGCFVCGDDGRCRQDEDSTGGAGSGGDGDSDGDSDGDDDCPTQGWLSACAGDYDLGVTGVLLRELTSVAQVCGNGTLVFKGGDAVEEAIAATGQVDYVDEETGGQFSGDFDPTRCSGAGKWGGEKGSGAWTLRKRRQP